MYWLGYERKLPSADFLKVRSYLFSIASIKNQSLHLTKSFPSLPLSPLFWSHISHFGYWNAEMLLLVLAQIFHSSWFLLRTLSRIFLQHLAVFNNYQGSALRPLLPLSFMEEKSHEMISSWQPDGSLCLLGFLWPGDDSCTSEPIPLEGTVAQLLKT